MSDQPHFPPTVVAQQAAQIDAMLPQAIAQLKELVAIPSVAWPSFDQAHVRGSAEAIARLAESYGFGDVDILTARTPDGEPGSPAVLASIPPASPELPTVMLYAHHDVQPPGESELWNTEPFEATEVGDRLFGRGCADDKAGVLVHLVAASELARTSGVGVTLFIEGEEEAGSPSFADFLARYRERLSADVIVVADSGNWAPGVPALTTSLRGLVGLEFEVSTLDHAVHSGMYGGVVPDAMLAMTRLLASLHRDDGSVAVAGLEGPGQPADVDYDEETFRRDAGVPRDTRLIGDPALGLSTRLWREPAITVIGLDLPNVDVSSNTLQPKLRAKISVRLAPGTSPRDALGALKDHLRAHAPWGAEVSFGADETGSPWAARAEDPVVRIAHEALSAAWSHGGPKVSSVGMGLGGSIPFIEDLLQQFPEASVLVTGVEDPDARAHSPNESLYLPDFRRAILAERLFLMALSGFGDATR